MCGFAPLRSAILMAVSVVLAAGMTDRGFLVVSAPRLSKISWIRIPESGNFSGLEPETLIDHGLLHPQGIAIDQKRKRLYVTDPTAQRIYSYQLVVNGNTLSTDGRQTVIAQNYEARWVAADGMGNVFFTCEGQQGNLVMKLPTDRVLRGEPNPNVLYGGTFEEVSAPGGIAVDNFHVYWANKEVGTMMGSVIKGPETLPTEAVVAQNSLAVLSKNVVKSYGVCLVLGNVFYTDDATYIYGVKKNGGTPTEISSGMRNPRGCVWDGDGTVYVADRSANGVFGFSGNMHTLYHAEVTKAFDLEDAFGIAVLAGAPRLWGATQAVLLALAATFFAC